MTHFSRFTFLNKLFITFFIFISFHTELVSVEKPSETTKEHLEKIIKRNSEFNGFWGTIGDDILISSYIQDIYYAYLHRVKDVEEFYRGMELFDSHLDSYKGMCNYMSDYFNFYKGKFDRPDRHMVPLYFDGKEVSGFMNTFKRGGPLTAEERELYFNQESSRFMNEHIEMPFILDAEALDNLHSGKRYNYALLPDGTIRASGDQPIETDYYDRDEMEDAFAYPNHTILAGSPHQAVVTAGAFVMYKSGEKRLFFVSCKSGHFQPYYDSLPAMRTQLAHLGINPYTVICVNDVNFSRSVLKIYNGAKIPLFVSTHDNERLFKIATKQWNKTYKKIDRNVFSAIAAGDFSVISLNLIKTIKKHRAESTYMRSAFQLFTADHKAPDTFSTFVKQYGKFKDLIKKYTRKELSYDKIQLAAAQLIELMDAYEKEMLTFEFIPADHSSFYTFLTGNINQLYELMARDSLSKVEYHDLKKLARELYTLFGYMANDVKFKGKGFFIYNTAADAFFQINDLMAKTDYIYAPVDESGEVRLKLPEKVINQLTRNLDHLGIAPPKIAFEFDSNEVFYMINSAKEIYTSKHVLYLEFEKIINGEMNETNIDYDEFLEISEWVLRTAEIARNALVFLHMTHDATEKMHQLISAAKEFVGVVAKRDFQEIKSKIKEMSDLCHEAPSAALQNYIMTDQAGLNETLKAHLSFFCVFTNQEVVSQDQFEEVFERVQAFRDLVHLIRQNGLYKKIDKTPSRFPMICFEALEDEADVLLEGMRRGSKVTPEMRRSAAIILERVDTE